MARTMNTGNRPMYRVLVHEGGHYPNGHPVNNTWAYGPYETAGAAKAQLNKAKNAWERHKKAALAANNGGYLTQYNSMNGIHNLTHVTQTITLQSALPAWNDV